MRNFVSFRIKDQLKLRKKKVLLLGLIGYTFVTVVCTSLIVRSGFIGNTLKPILKSNFLIPFNQFKSIFIDADHFSIDIKHKNVLKINDTRNKAKDINLFIAKPSDWVKAYGTYENTKLPLKIRLKGLQGDHWKDDGLWSFKIKLTGDNTLFGMKRFELQHPRTRNYMNDWYFHKMSGYLGIIAPRYGFIRVFINGKKFPIYNFEEGLDKRLIENNRRREAPTFKLIGKKLLNGTPHFYKNISFNQENYFSKNEYGKSLLKRIERLIDGYKNGKLIASEVFDINLMAKALAINDLFGDSHSLQAGNLAFYFNPLTGLIEPILYDNQNIGDVSEIGLIGEKTNQDFKNPYYFLDRKKEKSNESFLFKFELIGKLFLDPKFGEEYINALKIVSKKEWLDNFFENIKLEEKRNISLLHKNYPWYKFEDKKQLYKNQNYISSIINPNKVLNAIFREEEEKYKLIFQNKHSLPLEIISLTDKDKKDIYKFKKPYYLPNLKTICVDYLCNNKLKKILNKELIIDLPIKNYKFNNKTKVSYRVIGQNDVLEADLFNDLEYKFYKYDLDNIEKLNFLIIDNKEKSIKFKKGSWLIKQTIVFPKGFNIIIGNGTKIDLINNSSLISFSPIQIDGQEADPIIFYSSDKTGKGLSIINAKGKSKIKNMIFKEQGSFENGIFMTGSFNVYQSDIVIKDSLFINNFSEDSLNIFRSKALLDSLRFSRIKSDAIDFDFSEGNITNILFEDIGNDALDFSGTIANIENVKMKNIGDKGISAGEESEINLKNISIKNSYIGIASKDESTIRGLKIDISDSKVGLAAYQKKSEFGPGKIALKEMNLNNINREFLLEEFSSLNINQKRKESNIKNAYELLYKDF